MSCGESFRSSARQYRLLMNFLSFVCGNLARGKVCVPLMRAPEGVERDNKICEEWHCICQGEAMCSHGNKSHQRRQNGASDDGHDQKRSTQLGIWSEALQAERKDRWEHQGYEKTC